MTPPLFSQRSAFGFAAMWYVMHPQSYRAMPVDRHPWPVEIEWLATSIAAAPVQAELFAGQAS